jgi:hypothetical protein
VLLAAAIKWCFRVVLACLCACLVWCAAASASGYGSSFLSKAAVKGGANKKWAYKGITKSGRLIRVRRKAPHMAGQVSGSLQQCLAVVESGILSMCWSCLGTAGAVW